jgi:hypothetical protein
MTQHFFAPWSTRLKVMTVALVLICLVAAYAAKGWGSVVIVAIFVVAATFSIRGYSVMDGRLLIHRLGWSTKYDLSRLSCVEASPGATMGSIRAMGIGGLFGFVGYYHNEILGTYKAYATNELNTVILDFGGEKIVVTPDKPAEFAEAVEAAHTELAPAS